MMELELTENQKATGLLLGNFLKYFVYNVICFAMKCALNHH